MRLLSKVLQKYENPEVRFKGGCFVGDTLITMADGSKKPISEIKEGDWVLSVNPAGEFEPGLVVYVYKHLPEEYNNKLLRVKTEKSEFIITDNHWVFLAGITPDSKPTDYMQEIGILVANGWEVYDSQLKPTKIIDYEFLDERPVVYNLSVYPNPNFIANDILVHNKGKGKGGKAEVIYHDIVSIAEIQVWEDPTIVFEARLGNCLMIGDGSTRECYLPNFWKKKYVFSRGWGYVKMYPKEIKLYKNSLANELVEGTDYTYDRAIGKVTFTVPPAKGDVICFTATYDPEHPNNTTFYADFTFAEILRRIGLKYYKYEDESIDDYLKACVVSKNLISEIWKPIMTGTMNIVYNPFVDIGHTIYVKNNKIGFANNVFVKGINKSLSQGTVSTEIEVYTYPETTEISRLKGEAELFKFFVPELWITFLENNNNNYFIGDGMYFRGKILDPNQQLKFGFKDTLQLTLHMAEKQITFPNGRNTLDSEPIFVEKGHFLQYYSANFPKSLWTQTQLENEFQKWFDTDNPKYFVQKGCEVEIKNPETGITMVGGSSVYVAKEPPYQGYFAPIFPYPAFVTYYGNTDHLLIVDKEKTLWLVDMFLNSKKIGDLSDYIDDTSICIASDGVKRLFIMNREARDLVVYDIKQGQYVETLNIADCICGSLITNPTNLVTSYRSYPIIYVRGHSYKFDQPTIEYESYFNFLEIEPDNTVIKYKINFDSDSRALSGYPMLYRNALYFGAWAFDLKKITENYSSAVDVNPKVKFYEMDFDFNTHSDYIVDSLEEVLNGTSYDVNFVKVNYVRDKTRLKLYALISKSNDYNASELMNAYIEDSRFMVLEKTDSGWVRKIEFVSSEITDKNSFRIYPIYVYENKIVCAVMGNELKRRIHADITWALGVIDLSTGKLKIILAKYYGQEITSTYSKEAMALVESIWFKDKVLINWKDYEDLIDSYWNDPIGVISGVLL